MKCSITRSFTFEAAHHLPHHGGKCRALHGHSYALDVTVRGEIRPVAPGSATGPAILAPTIISHLRAGDEPGQMQVEYDVSPTAVAEPDASYRSDVGMVMDFADVDATVTSRVIAALDHHVINDVWPGIYPTAENLALHIFDIVRLAVTGNGQRRDIEVTAVTLRETARSAATVTIDDYMGRR